MNRDARAAFDMARIDHLAKIAALDAFVTNTAANLMREAQRQEQFARDPKRSAFEQNEARQLRDGALADYQAFLAAKGQEDWKPSAGTAYEIGNRRVATIGGVVREEDSPKGLASATANWFKETAQAIASGVAQGVDTIHRSIVEFTTFDECVLAMGLFKGGMLATMFPPGVTGGRIGTELFNHGLGEAIKPEEEFCRVIYRPQDWRELIRLYGDSGLEADFAVVEAAGLLPTSFTVSQEVFSQVAAYQSALDEVMHMNSLDELNARLNDALLATADFEGSRRAFADSLSATLVASLESAGFSATQVDDTRWLLQRQDGNSEVTIDATLDLLAPADAGGGLRISGLRVVDESGASAQLDAEALTAFGVRLEDLAVGNLPAGAASFIEGLQTASLVGNGWPEPAPVEIENPQGFTRTLELPNGFTLTSTYDSDRRLIEVTESFSPNATTQQIQTFAINADGSRTLRTTAVRDYSPDSTFIQQEIDAATGHIYRVVRDDNLEVTRTLDTSAMRLRDQQRAVTIYSDVMGLTAAIRAGKPLPALASGVRLINDLSVASNIANTNLAAAGNVAAGYLSFYNLYNAFDTGSDFDRINSSLTALNYANEAFSIVGGTGGAVSNFLNGAGGGAGGTVGVLAVVGLIASLKEGDAIGAAISVGSIASATFLSTNPIGWALLAANVMRSFFADDRPQAWGVASVTFGAGFDLSVQADGEAFGPDQARARLQSIVDTLQGLVADNNARQADSAQHLGIIPQRLPGLSFRAADFQDKGFAVQDIDALSGAQRMPALRFASDGQPFGLASDAMSEQDRAMLTLDGAPQVEPLMAYMLNSALQRGAIAPQWEVRTAQLQQQVGDPNAGLMEEERAAKAGLAAPVDAAYAAAHPDDPQAANRRQGRFMPVGVDLSGDGRIATRTLEQTAGTDIRFDWDGQGYQKRTGWIGQEDGFLVLDHDFNQSVDTAKELFSNPLVAEAGKGLRLLAAYDANGDGRIDAQDPVYEQLRVWQDLDQDGDNTRMATVSGQSVRVQDETNGVGELRTLRELGISAIDYANQRFERGGGWGLIATQALQAEDEGQRYTPVGAGVQIEWSDAAPQIVLTAVQSEAAVYRGMEIAVAGETVGTPEAPLFEDGLPTPFDPLQGGGPREIVVSAAQLLQNDTWAGAQGAAAGLRITGVRGGPNVQVSLREDGDISLRLTPNYHGAAEFFYTVALPGLEAQVAPQEARVGLSITPVNDEPVAAVAYDAPRAIYGWHPAPYRFEINVAGGASDFIEPQIVSGTARGRPHYAPFTEVIPGEPIYQTVPPAGGEDDMPRTMLVGYTPARTVHRDQPVAQDLPNTGRVTASDVDGGSFRFEVIRAPLYGTASVAADGSWSYVGRRPAGIVIPGIQGDINGDGVADWAPFDATTPRRYDQVDVDSNAYGPDESAPFADPFTVRVHDLSDPSGATFRDVQVVATHYGPLPSGEVIFSSGRPVVLDLDGDGFHFSDVAESDVLYDITGDGWRRPMAWIAPGDGLLAFDKDGNGRIEHADEISFVPYAPEAQTDMEALRLAFDSDGNGRFDAQDEAWARFGIWRDADSDGVTDEGEFLSLGDWGIASIDVTTDGQFRVIDGQSVHGIGSAMRSDGSRVAVADVSLRYRNEARVTTRGADGNAATTAVPLPLQSPGQHFSGTPEADLVFGTRGSDAFAMGAQGDVVVDDGGNDYVEGGAGDDHLFTGADNDVVLAGDGNDTVFTGAGNDLVFGDGAGESGDDLIVLEDGNDVAFGGAGNDIIAGGAGNDVLSGNAGDDSLFGEDGWDALFGQEGNDALWGMAGDDLLVGGEGDDLLDGGEGDDAMEGGAGDDTYHYEIGGGLDTVSDSSGTDTIRFGAGLTLERVSLRIVTHGNGAIAQVRILDEAGQEQAGQGIDFAMEVDALGRLGAPIERFAFEGGSVHTWDELLVRSTPLVGSARADRLLGGRGDERMDGGAGDDVLYGGSGRDTLHGAAGNDVLFGGRGNDVLWGDTGADLLYGHHGDDQLHGEDGDDYLLDRSGNNLFSGGYGRDIAQAGPGADRLDLGAQADLADAGGGDDVILAGSGDDWVAAGRGNDLIDLGSGCNLLAFDRGDGADVLTGGGRDTLSLGAGIRLADLSLARSGHDLVLARSGHDLVLGLGEGDSLTLRDWYCGSAWQTVERLQVLTDPADRDAAGQDRLRNHAVEVFDFSRLVRSFDRARAAELGRAGGYGGYDGYDGYDGYGGHGGSPAATDAAAGWAAMNSLLDAHLGGSDSAAHGGDLSAQYHARGSLSGLDLGAAQRVLAQGGADWQALRPRSELAQGALVTLA